MHEDASDSSMNPKEVRLHDGREQRWCQQQMRMTMNDSRCSNNCVGTSEYTLPIEKRKTNCKSSQRKTPRGMQSSALADVGCVVKKRFVGAWFSTSHHTRSHPSAPCPPIPHAHAHPPHHTHSRHCPGQGVLSEGIQVGGGSGPATPKRSVAHEYTSTQAHEKQHGKTMHKCGAEHRAASLLRGHLPQAGWACACFGNE